MEHQCERHGLRNYDTKVNEGTAGSIHLEIAIHGPSPDTCVGSTVVCKMVPGCLPRMTGGPDFHQPTSKPAVVCNPDPAGKDILSMQMPPSLPEGAIDIHVQEPTRKCQNRDDKTCAGGKISGRPATSTETNLRPPPDAPSAARTRTKPAYDGGEHVSSMIRPHASRTTRRGPSIPELVRPAARSWPAHIPECVVSIASRAHYFPSNVITAAIAPHPRR